MQALGPVFGFDTWFIPGIRRGKALEKLQNFIKEHPPANTAKAASVYETASAAGKKFAPMATAK
jgi:hypothetical protein